LIRFTAAAALLLALLHGPAGPPGRTPEAERIAALPEEDRVWLTEFVAPIILAEERRVFLELSQPYQRDYFKSDFWARRERDGLPRPFGPGYRSRYAELRRLADEKYDGWKHDAGRVVLRWGEPDSIFSPQCPGEKVFYDLEVWSYRPGSGAASGSHIFYRPAPYAPRKLWTVRDELGGRNRFIEIATFEPPFQMNSCHGTMKSLLPECAAGTKGCPLCEDYCSVYRAYLEIRNRQTSLAGSESELAALFRFPSVSTEGLDRQKDRWASTADPNAKPLHVEGGTSRQLVSAPTPVPTPTPEPVRDLSDEEIRERLLALEKPYRDWLEAATPLLTREQLSRFLQLSSAEKDRFIREGWRKRK
jgi:GWxTD domain-containing protein